MKMTLFSRRLLSILTCLVPLLFSNGAIAEQLEGVNSFTAPEKLGYSEVAKLSFDVSVKKTRDIKIVLRRVRDNKIIRDVNIKIKKSGKYNLPFDPKEELKPGKYGLTVYLTKRHKGWEERLHEPKYTNIRVLNKPKAPEPKKVDKITGVNWPSLIKGNGENKLEIHFGVTEPRNLHIVLIKRGETDQQNKNIASLNFPQEGAGTVTLPIVNMVKDFSAGRYMWKIYLSPTEADKPIGKPKWIPFEIRE